MQPRSDRDLDVWQQAMRLAVEAYRLSCLLPAQEKFVLANQLRRAAVSVPSNIAEGNRRSYRREYIHHVCIARGSLAELETLFDIACHSGYSTSEDMTRASELTDRVGRMLTRLVSALRK